jgi:hypothetical protein
MNLQILSLNCQNDFIHSDPNVGGTAALMWSFSKRLSTVIVEKQGAPGRARHPLWELRVAEIQFKR